MLIFEGLSLENGVKQTSATAAVRGSFRGCWLTFWSHSQGVDEVPINMMRSSTKTQFFTSLGISLRMRLRSFRSEPLDFFTKTRSMSSTRMIDGSSSFETCQESHRIVRQTRPAPSRSPTTTYFGDQMDQHVHSGFSCKKKREKYAVQNQSTQKRTSEKEEENVSTSLNCL